MTRRAFYIAILLIAALIDLPRSVMLGSISASGILTILYGVIVALLLVAEWRRVKSSAALIWPLVLLFGWVLLSCLWHWPSKLGFQEILSLEIFLGLIVLFAMPEERGSRQLDVGKFFRWSMVISAALYSISLALQGPGAESILGARTFALFALLGMSWYLAGWVNGSWRSLLYALVLLMLIGLSLSRTAFAVGILLLPLSKLGRIRKRELAQAALIGVIECLFVPLAVSNIPPLADRFLGDDTLVDLATGDASLDVSGRALAWGMVLDDSTRSPWMGGGAGSSGDLMSSLLYNEAAHVHNEYLRFLHDYGIIGLGLFLIGMGGLLRKCWVARYKASPVTGRNGQMRLAAFLGLVGVLLSMVTDNTGSYVYVMCPLAMMIGTALIPSANFGVGKNCSA